MDAAGRVTQEQLPKNEPQQPIILNNVGAHYIRPLVPSMENHHPRLRALWLF